MKLGAGKAKISIPQELFPLEQFGAIHDDLYVRSMIFQAGISFAIISFEATSLRPYAVRKFRSLASELTGVAEERIWVCVTHTFSAPHLRSEEALARDAEIARKNDILFQNMTDAMKQALRQALEGMEPVRMVCGTTECNVNINRDVYTVDGWWLGADEKGISDKSVPCAGFETMAGAPKAILYNYDVQSSIMDHSVGNDGYALVSGDLAGRASRFLEEQYHDNLVALFLSGAAGDQAPILKTRSSITDCGGVTQKKDLGEAGFAFVEKLGNELGARVLQAVETYRTQALNFRDTGTETDGLQASDIWDTGAVMGSETKGRAVSDQELCVAYSTENVICPGQKIAASIRDIHPTHSYEFVEEEDRKTPVSVFALGKIALAGVEPELSSVTAREIRKASPYPVTMVATMVNGGDKYMPDKTAYDRITYEAMNSRFAAGSAEIVQGRIMERLKEMKRSESV